MPIHDWTRVRAGTFHDFHSGWIIHLKETLNRGLLPEGYYALAEQQAGEIQSDVLTLHTSNGVPFPSATASGGLAIAEAPPQVSLRMVPDEAATYRLSRRTLTIRHSSDHRIVALLEIVSPSNKDRDLSVEQFADKALAAIRQGCLVDPGSVSPEPI